MSKDVHVLNIIESFEDNFSRVEIKQCSTLLEVSNMWAVLLYNTYTCICTGHLGPLYLYVYMYIVFIDLSKDWSVVNNAKGKQ